MKLGQNKPPILVKSPYIGKGKSQAMIQSACEFAKVGELDYNGFVSVSITWCGLEV